MTLFKMEQGHGRIVLHNNGFENSFSELAATYPLKLLSPRLPSPDVSIVYMLSYGGGLVGGDNVLLEVEVHDKARLVILTQGSTKVFKTRPGQRPSANFKENLTAQNLNVRAGSGSALFLLPDPVTCFRDARYHQTQTFHLSKGSSMVLLDWVTSGRKSLGEQWDFSRYYSLNEIYVDGRRIAKDAMLLQEAGRSTSSLNARSLAESLAPYSCYANVIIYGPLVQETVQNLSAAYGAITVYKQHVPPPLLWSFSAIFDGEGCIVRVAAIETEIVRNWLSTALRDLEKILSVDVYRRALS